MTFESWDDFLRYVHDQKLWYSSEPGLRYAMLPMQLAHRVGLTQATLAAGIRVYTVERVVYRAVEIALFRGWSDEELEQRAGTRDPRWERLLVEAALIGEGT